MPVLTVSNEVTTRMLFHVLHLQKVAGICSKTNKFLLLFR